jgi:hypothetical protein
MRSIIADLTQSQRVSARIIATQIRRDALCLFVVAARRSEPRIKGPLPTPLGFPSWMSAIGSPIRRFLGQDRTFGYASPLPAKRPVTLPVNRLIYARAQRVPVKTSANSSIAVPRERAARACGSHDGNQLDYGHLSHA